MRSGFGCCCRTRDTTFNLVILGFDSNRFDEDRATIEDLKSEAFERALRRAAGRGGRDGEVGFGAGVFERADGDSPLHAATPESRQRRGAEDAKDPFVRPGCAAARWLISEPCEVTTNPRMRELRHHLG